MRTLRERCTYTTTILIFRKHSTAFNNHWLRGTELIYSQSVPDQTQTGLLNTSLGETHWCGINWRTSAEQWWCRGSVNHTQMKCWKGPICHWKCRSFGPGRVACLKCVECVSSVCVIYYPKTQLMSFQPQDIRETKPQKSTDIKYRHTHGDILNCVAYCEIFHFTPPPTHTHLWLVDPLCIMKLNLFNVHKPYGRVSNSHF